MLIVINAFSHTGFDDLLFVFFSKFTFCSLKNVKYEVIDLPLMLSLTFQNKQRIF